MEKINRCIACVLLALLQFTALGQFSAKAQSTTGVYSVAVNTPGTFGQVMLQTVDNWSDVVELTIIGSIDSCDMDCFSKMNNIEKLDLSQTDIKKIHGCADLKKLRSVTLPMSVSEVADSAFAGCSVLNDINLDMVYKIGDYGFSYCMEMKDVRSSMLQLIGSMSFYKCSQLETFMAPNVETVGGNAFCYCSNLSSG